MVMDFDPIVPSTCEGCTLCCPGCSDLEWLFNTDYADQIGVFTIRPHKPTCGAVKEGGA